jgi:hypothetical protein
MGGGQASKRQDERRAESAGRARRRGDGLAGACYGKNPAIKSMIKEILLGRLLLKMQ